MPKMKMPKNRTAPKTEKSFWVSVLIGTLFALLIGFILLIVSALIALRLEDPETITPLFALVSLFFTAFLGGYASARIHKESGFVCGAVSGIFLIGILVLLVFACSFSIYLPLFAICAPSAVLVSSLAGVGGVNGGKEKKTKRKKGF